MIELTHLEALALGALVVSIVVAAGVHLAKRWLL